MRCIHPTTAYYRDLLGVRHSYVRPCGRCIACLHNKQDAWMIRAYEATKAHPQFVYDTLTFRPASLPLVELSDIISNSPYLEVSPSSFHALRYYSEDCSKIPYVDRLVFREWIRRGRENYAKDHGGKRAKWSYMLFMEYGPKTSRPHAHLLFWGISQEDYIKYLGLPWRVRYGMTKPSYFNGDSSEKDRACISRYISKYCSKGVFDSPWVKDGLLPKPCKLVSQGLGVEYLNGSAFDWFRGILPSLFRDMAIDTRFESGTLQRVSHVRSLIRDVDITEGFEVPESALDALSVYWFKSSLGAVPHALPRYYKQKLLNLLKPNVLSFTLQSHLLARTLLQYYKNLQGFARSLVIRVGELPRIFGTSLAHSTLGLSRRVFDLLCHQFAAFEAVQAKAAAERRRTWLKNHYKRPMLGVNDSPEKLYGVTSQFLAMVC